jgi:hypothetical protein
LGTYPFIPLSAVADSNTAAAVVAVKTAPTNYKVHLRGLVLPVHEGGLCRATFGCRCRDFNRRVTNQPKMNEVA